MANENILQEYLVKLGFTTDSVGFARFSSALRDASSLVDSQYFRMAKSVVAFEAAGIGAFAAIGAAAIGIVDKTAMADQSYRLLALHMYTSLPIARELKIALDALGQPLENVMWDAELAGRFDQLVKDQQILTEQLGPNFENQMVKIRDVRFEFTRLGVELQYLTMNIVQGLASAFGTDIDGMLDKLRHFNAWFIANIPYFSYEISTKLKPVLLDVKEILGDTGGLLEQLGIDYIHFVGILTGDKALQNSKGGFDDLTTAIQESVDAIAHMIEVTLKLGTNLALLFDAGQNAATGNFGAAGKDLQKMQPIFALPNVPDEEGLALTGAARGLATPAAVREAIIISAQKLGIPPQVALAVADVESGFQQFDQNGKPLLAKEYDPNTGKELSYDDPRRKSHAMGVMQLQPDTAKRLGVDPSDPGQNIWGGVELLAQIAKFSNYDWAKTFGEYHGGDKIARSLYSQSVLSRLPSEGQFIHSGDVHVQVTANTNASAKDIAAEVQAVIEKQFDNSMKNMQQRNIAQFQATGWAMP